MRHWMRDGDLVVIVETGFPCRVGTGETESEAIACLMITSAMGTNSAAVRAALWYAYLQGWVSAELLEEEGVEV